MLFLSKKKKKMLVIEISPNMSFVIDLCSVIIDVLFNKRILQSALYHVLYGKYKLT